ncbi:MAG: GNAT family N-acetyltransferase [Gammaproteobacteria bacterium]|nr:GNAT family N-acetyltransferase [Gammaproteobacteria bacterium]MDH5650336.1 GNAT family N-acetyltransferase [Gammaproteobacteria bacterium]
MSLQVIQADYANPLHAQAIVELLVAYAVDPMGGGQPLTAEVRNNIVPALAAIPHALSLLAFKGDTAVGLMNCFEAFSTFACKPIINIHDVVVTKEYRGSGIAQQMLHQVEVIARTKGCCKLTLEVLSHNEAAMAAYRKFGFTDYQLDPAAGSALFWQKSL